MEYLGLIMIMIMGIVSIGSIEGKVPALFVFGDSLVDVGNNNYLPFSLARADHPPYGIDYVNSTPTGRFSNGLNAVDFLAQLVGLPSPLSYLSPFITIDDIVKGVNYASAGSGIMDETGSSIIQRITFSQQIKYFEKTYYGLVGSIGKTSADELLSRALFIITVGSNDCLRYFSFGSIIGSMHIPQQQYVSNLVATLRPQLQRLIGMGVQNLLMVEVGPIGCTPSLLSQRSKNGECFEPANDLVVQLNTGISGLLVELSEKNPSFRYSLTNTYEVLLTIINNPSHFGFEISTTACCGLGRYNGQTPCLANSVCRNRSAYVFWDLFHPSEAVVHLFVNDLFTHLISSKNVATSPLNIQQLVTIND